MAAMAVRYTEMPLAASARGCGNGGWVNVGRAVDNETGTQKTGSRPCPVIKDEEWLTASHAPFWPHFFFVGRDVLNR